MPRTVNAITFEQLTTSCRHVHELMALGMTENLAIRNLEQFANIYAKVRIVGNASPDRADQYDVWSKAALKAKTGNPDKNFGQYVRVEHGTPRRKFARMVLSAFDKGALTDQALNELVDKYWKVAVITLEEDRQLNAVARQDFDSPDERWRAVGIEFS